MYKKVVIIGLSLVIIGHLQAGDGKQGFGRLVPGQEVPEYTGPLIHLVDTAKWSEDHRNALPQYKKYILQERRADTITPANVKDTFKSDYNREYWNSLWRSYYRLLGVGAVSAIAGCAGHYTSFFSLNGSRVLLLLATSCFVAAGISKSQLQKEFSTNQSEINVIHWIQNDSDVFHEAHYALWSGAGTQGTYAGYKSRFQQEGSNYPNEGAIAMIDHSLNQIASPRKKAEYQGRQDGIQRGYSHLVGFGIAAALVVACKAPEIITLHCNNHSLLDAIRTVHNFK